MNALNSPQAADASTRRVDVPLNLDTVLSTLIADGLCSPAAAQALLAKPLLRGEHRHPLVRVAACDWDNPTQPGRKLTLEALMQWLAGRAGLPYLRIDPLGIEVARITTVMPYAYASRLKILPIKVQGSEVTIATSEPWVFDWVNDLKQALKLDIKRVVANPIDIDRYLVEFYALARSVKASGEERAKLVNFGSARSLEQLTDLGRRGQLTADDSHVVNIVDWLLQYAFESRASDIHLEPRRDSGNVRFRIDGVLHEVYQIPAPVMVAVTSRIKILGRMDVAEKRKPQDGRIKTRSPDGKEIELRCSSLPTAFGEKLVMRIFDPEVLVKDFRQLGFNEAEAKAWAAMIEQPNGIVLVTGPTGSGKTTTLYSSLKQLATPQVNVCTIEDPIELVDGSFNQMQVQPNIELGFAEGIRALMRQDPDIIMVGEIRDLETAEIAIQAALTGHLVLSTLHTNDAPSAISRLLDLGVPGYLIKSTLLGVVAQRLVRKLCPHCKRAAVIEPERWAEISGGWPIDRPAQIYAPVGCLECRETGYLGRVGIYEIMPLSATLNAAISATTDLMLLRQQALKDGMMPLRIAGCVKLAEGVTSVEEVLGLAAFTKAA
ncbi:GspE/PulE family protein [uncultured Nevskia sp.]|uniref:GspE/PulE family protein n=1 Tax=uncultured Nevskia sp. TaxID=228950 RepID=UPI0025D3475F|nr:GspE/PulE family protein [uncultured Nevskia sp.]